MEPDPFRQPEHPEEIFVLEEELEVPVIVSPKELFEGEVKLGVFEVDADYFIVQSLYFGLLPYSFLPRPFLLPE